MNFEEIKNISRILIEVDLKPLQGNRFQPTGFPDLGAATYRLPDNTDALLVESTQSMANRLEAVCLDGDNLVSELEGIPFVKVIKDGKILTNTMLESHRLSSSYIIQNEKDTMWIKMKDALGIDEKDNPSIDHMIKQLHKFLFEVDPNSLLHGIFFAKKGLVGGRLRIPRALSAFIEATGVKEVISGGAKMDIVDPSTNETHSASEGFGNVPFSRREYTAERITAYFNLDISQIIKYNLEDDEKHLLVCIALWKIRRFLDAGLRLRTACDLIQSGDMRITRPEKFTIPIESELAGEIKTLIKKCENHLGEPLEVTFKSK